ncbi:MAG: hypothetical protein ACO288_01195, partial [Ilumatobacteraceae bacterium]
MTRSGGTAMTTRTVVKGGRIVDSRGEQRVDVAIQHGVIVEVGERLTGDHMVDATGCVVAPGFV